MASTSRVKILDLPNEIMVSIFSFLPVAALAQCAATCEQWYGIVTGFTLLWKGKRYESIRRSTECAEARAILHALPPLKKVTITSRDGFVLRILYPHMELSLKYLGSLKTCQRLRCEDLETTLEIAGDILSHRSIIDFDRLRHLHFTQKHFYRDYSAAEYVVLASLSLCPNLQKLTAIANFASAKDLDVIEGRSQLQWLTKIKCCKLLKQSLQQDCSGGLEKLELVDCTGLPSRALANLPRLQNLRKLCMRRCHFEESDLASAVAGLANLEFLELHCCSSISNLSFLQHCVGLQELYITTSDLMMAVPMFTPANEWMHLLRLPSRDDDEDTQCLRWFTLTAASLLAAMRELEEMGMSRSCLDYLGALRNCTDLAHICCEFAFGHSEAQLYNVRVHIILNENVTHFGEQQEKILIYLF